MRISNSCLDFSYSVTRPVRGLGKISRAPASNSRNTLSVSSSCTDALMTKIGHGKCSMTNSVSCRPSIRGMCRSVQIRLGLTWGINLIAASPLGAVPTISISGSSCKTRLKIVKATGESSTSRIRMGLVILQVVTFQAAKTGTNME